MMSEKRRVEQMLQRKSSPGRQKRNRRRPVSSFTNAKLPLSSCQTILISGISNFAALFMHGMNGKRVTRANVVILLNDTTVTSKISFFTQHFMTAFAGEIGKRTPFKFMLLWSIFHATLAWVIPDDEQSTTTGEMKAEKRARCRVYWQLNCYELPTISWAANKNFPDVVINEY